MENLFVSKYGVWFGETGRGKTYIVVKQLRTRRRRVGFCVRNESTEEEYWLNDNQIRLLMEHGYTFGITYKGNDEEGVVFEDGRVISNMPKQVVESVGEIKDVLNNDLVYYTHKKLAGVRSAEHLDVVVQYLMNSETGKIMCITETQGKCHRENLLLQAASTQKFGTAYVKLRKGDGLLTFYDTFDSLVRQGNTRILVNNTHYLKGLNSSVGRLADIYATRGIRVVLASTRGCPLDAGKAYKIQI